MTNVSVLHARSAASALALVTALVVAALLLAPGARSGGSSITYSPQSPTTTTGVYFTVSSGGGNRDFASVEVICKDTDQAIVYDTVLTVQVPPGVSQTIHPPASSCVANLEKQQSIGRARILASVSFTVAP